MQALKVLLFSITIFTTNTLVGCNQESETPSSTNIVETKNEPENHSKVEEYISPLPSNAPTYRVAISADSPPFEFKNEFGNLVGYDIDLIRAIGEESGFKVEFHEVPLANLKSSLIDGKYDLNLSSWLEVDTNFSSSQPYMHGNLVYLVKRDSSFKNIEDLRNKTIAVQQNTILENILQNEIPSATSLPEQSLFLAMQSLFTNKADAVIGEEAILMYQSTQFEDHPIRFIFSKQPEQNRAIFSAKKNKREIINKVNEGFQSIKSSGKYDIINQKWFGMYATSLEMK